MILRGDMGVVSPWKSLFKRRCDSLLGRLGPAYTLKLVCQGRFPQLKTALML